MSYIEIERGLASRGIGCERVAEALGTSADTVEKKLGEWIPLTVDEAKKIRDAFFLGRTLDELLATDGDVPSEKEKELASIDAAKDVLDELGVGREWYEALDAMREEAEAR